MFILQLDLVVAVAIDRIELDMFHASSDVSLTVSPVASTGQLHALIRMESNKTVILNVDSKVVSGTCIGNTFHRASGSLVHSLLDSVQIHERPTGP